MASLRLALDFFYPAALGLCSAHRAGALRATPLREFLGRQTGMYRFANAITDEQAREMTARICHDDNCIRRILWPLNDTELMDGPAAAKTRPQTGYPPAADTTRCLPLLCVEPCPFIVGEARKLARQKVGQASSLPAE